MFDRPTLRDLVDLVFERPVRCDGEPLLNGRGKEPHRLVEVNRAEENKEWRVQLPNVVDPKAIMHAIDSPAAEGPESQWFTLVDGLFVEAK